VPEAREKVVPEAREKVVPEAREKVVPEAREKNAREPTGFHLLCLCASAAALHRLGRRQANLIGSILARANAGRACTRAHQSCVRGNCASAIPCSSSSPKRTA
jgi:hypothetical protein